MLAPNVTPTISAQERLVSFRQQFASQKRIVVDGLVAPELVDRVASLVAALPFTPAANVPIEGATGGHPHLWHHSALVEVERQDTFTPLEALVLSITCGPIRDFVAAVTGRDQLQSVPTARGNRAVLATAYPRGAYTEAHADGGSDRGLRPSVGLVFHLSRTWDPSWGGDLRFTEEPVESYFPRFGALNVFDAGAHNRHEVRMVTGPRVRYCLFGFLVEPS